MVALTFADDFSLPAFSFRVTLVHARQVAGKYRGFVTAGACADFQENIAIVVGIFGQQQDLQFKIQRGYLLLRLIDFFFGQFPKLRVSVVSHFFGRGQILLRLFIAFVTSYQWSDLGVFLAQGAKFILVTLNFGFRKQGGDFVVTFAQVFQFKQYGLFH